MGIKLENILYIVILCNFKTIFYQLILTLIKCSILSIPSNLVEDDELNIYYKANKLICISNQKKSFQSAWYYFL
jgi:hypothetical protein